jgi:hypothetical protein
VLSKCLAYAQHKDHHKPSYARARHYHNHKRKIQTPYRGLRRKTPLAIYALTFSILDCRHLRGLPARPPIPAGRWSEDG